MTMASLISSCTYIAFLPLQADHKFPPTSVDDGHHHITKMQIRSGGKGSFECDISLTTKLVTIELEESFTNAMGRDLILPLNFARTGPTSL
jgi:hypothetical protein